MVKYKISVKKDHKTVSVHYDLSVPVGSAELIASCAVYIDGKDVIEESAANNTRFFGTAFAKVNENKDVEVAFNVTSNTDFSADGNDTLRAGHPFDDVDWSN